MSPCEMQLSHIISLAGEVLFAFYGSFCNVMSFIHFEKKCIFKEAMMRLNRKYGRKLDSIFYTFTVLMHVSPINTHFLK